MKEGRGESEEGREGKQKTSHPIPSSRDAYAREPAVIYTPRDTPPNEPCPHRHQN